MDNARALTIAGTALAVAALLGLFLIFTGGEDEAPAIVPPPEREAMPTAPSQTPDVAERAPVEAMPSGPLAPDAFEPEAEGV